MMRIYTDTSVIGGCFDPEFEIWSKKLFDQFQTGFHKWLLSDIVMQELTNAPIKVQEIQNQVPEKNIQMLNLTQKSENLADLYLDAGKFSEKFRFDARHIAIATIA